MDNFEIKIPSSARYSEGTALGGSDYVVSFRGLKTDPYMGQMDNFETNISSSASYSGNTLSLCSSLNVRAQVSHPYRTRGKIKVMFILIFEFLDRKLHDTRTLDP
jgi:hypothetical protein